MLNTQGTAQPAEPPSCHNQEGSLHLGRTTKAEACYLLNWGVALQLLGSEQATSAMIHACKLAISYPVSLPREFSSNSVLH